MANLNHTEQVKQMQQEELEVLESIFPECVFFIPGSRAVRLEIPIELESPRRVKVTSVVGPLSHNINEGKRLPLEVVLSTLPTIMLSITLPEAYPFERPPEIESIRSKYSWIPETSRIYPLLIDKWQAGLGILYDWVEYLRVGSFLTEVGLVSLNAADAIEISHPTPWLLLPLLLSFEQSTRSKQFSDHSFTCVVCLTSQKGSKCVQLSCQHVFCRSCLEEGWKIYISEGDVGRVGCLDPECVKGGREASEDEVARIVSGKELERWKWLKEKRIYDKDPTVVVCPIEFCQAPVPKGTLLQDNAGWERLRSCPQCTFSFCVFCRRTWHGPITPCLITHSEKLLEEYLRYDEGSEERMKVEQRYGKRNIERLLKAHEEQKLNEEWLKSSTTNCPGCNVHVEKSLGCNHITCGKCGQHFCYRCGAVLNAGNPYVHFSTRGISCYNKLFDGGDGEEWEAVFAD